jgi:hypothetical protein
MEIYIALLNPAEWPAYKGYEIEAEDLGVEGPCSDAYV